MAQQNLGEWDAHPVESPGDAFGALDEHVLDLADLVDPDESVGVDDRPRPEHRSAPDGIGADSRSDGDGGDGDGHGRDDGRSSGDGRSDGDGDGRSAGGDGVDAVEIDGDGAREAEQLDRRPAFWLGMLLALLPVIAVLGGLVGYLLANRGDDRIAAVDGLTEAARAEVAAPSVSTTSPLSAATTAPATTQPTARPEELVASGLVTDDVIELAGALPAERQSQWTAEIDDLADVLGRRVVDGTEVADTGAGSAELTIRFPGAIVYQPDSASTFVGAPDPVFEAVAGVLNRGTASLVLVSYADPTDPAAAVLALQRAGHAQEHLVDLGVSRERISVETRPLVEAPAGVAADVIDRRTDFEIGFRA